MWSKTFAAIVGGCLLSISIMLNLNYLLTFAVDAKLMLGLLVGFPIWCFAMVMCYSSKNAWQAWKRCMLPFVASVSINIVYFIG